MSWHVRHWRRRDDLNTALPSPSSDTVQRIETHRPLELPPCKFSPELGGEGAGKKGRVCADWTGRSEPGEGERIKAGPMESRKVWGGHPEEKGVLGRGQEYMVSQPTRFCYEPCTFLCQPQVSSQAIKLTKSQVQWFSSVWRREEHQAVHTATILSDAQMQS